MVAIRNEDELREDGRANRARVQAAARELFREMGPAITTSAVAERAGVGRATLYRTYPTRHDMIVEVVRERLIEWCDLVENALANTSASEPILGPTMRSASERAVATWEAGTDVTDHIAEVRSLKERGDKLFVRLVHEAVARGELEPETTPEELIVLFRALARAVPEEQRGDPSIWNRYYRIVLRGLRP